MSQLYHSNAKTNVHIRTHIRKSHASNFSLARKYSVSIPTIAKWKKRDNPDDRSSKPHTIHYAVPLLTCTLICVIRQLLWVSREEIAKILSTCNINLSRSSIYRCLVCYSINKKPKDAKPPYKKFKEYQPGFVHIDVTYLPKIEGKRKYLFVAIDRATRLLFYKIYDNKTADNASDFLLQCRGFFPFDITTVLTDNGKEFTNRYHKGRKNKATDKLGKFDEACGTDIEHRLTKPGTPKTNGMVERVNLTIKSHTIHKSTYRTWKELEQNLDEFLVFYNCYRRHGSLVKELNVKTPIEAVRKWSHLEPELVENIFAI